MVLNRAPAVASPTRSTTKELGSETEQYPITRRAMASLVLRGISENIRMITSPAQNLSRAWLFITSKQITLVATSVALCAHPPAVLVVLDFGKIWKFDSQP